MLWIEAPVAPGIWTVAARYERALLPRLSVSAAVELGGGYSVQSWDNAPSMELLSRYGGAHVGISHYLGAEALSGMYLHARLGVGGAESSTKTAIDGTNVAAISSIDGWFGPSAAAMVGYAWVSESGFAIQFAAGIRGSYQWSGYRTFVTVVESTHRTMISVAPATNLSIGVAF